MATPASTAHSPAYERFVASMRIGYAEWHDGIPYALDALDEVTASERDELERKLVPRRNRDWRDSEALARLGTPAAMQALRASLAGPKREVRLRAAELLHEKGLPVDLEDLIIEGLRNADIADGFGQATSLAARFPTPRIEQTLLQGARCGPDRGLFYVEVLLYLHGKAKSLGGDYENQGFRQRFNRTRGAEREQAFQELCAQIGVDPASVSCSPPFPKARPPFALAFWGGAFRVVGALRFALLLVLRLLLPAGLAALLWRCVGPLVQSSTSFHCLLHC
jgi:hypothetical protein